MTPLVCTLATPENAVEYAQLKVKIESHIDKWGDQQQDLITDTFSNSEAALAKFVSFYGGRYESLRNLTGNSTNIVWAGSGAILEPTPAGEVGLAAVILGIAANAAIDYAAGGTLGTAKDAVDSALRTERQRGRDQVNALEKEWEQKYIDLLGTAETCKDVAALKLFLGSAEAELRVVDGAAPKPPAVNRIYGKMLWNYVESRGWRTFIVGSQWHEDNFGTYWHVDTTAAGVMLSTSLPYFHDPQDIADELNSIGYR